MRRKAGEAARARDRQAAAASQDEAEEREKNIGLTGRLFTAWRVSHDERNERRAEREEAGLSRGRRLRARRTKHQW